MTCGVHEETHMTNVIDTLAASVKRDDPGLPRR